MSERERNVARTFADLVDALVHDYDLADHLTTLCERCARLLDDADIGLILSDESGVPRLVASSSQQMHLVELIEMQSHEGPCLDVEQTGRPIVNAALDGVRWPRFAPRAAAAGYRLAHALPLRHGDRVLGALNVFDRSGRPMGEGMVEVTQAIADLSMVSILHHRTMERVHRMTDQLQHALRSRVAIEQAKGVLAERFRISTEEAFESLRRHARERNQKVADVAAEVVEGTLPDLRVVLDLTDVEQAHEAADRPGGR